MNYTLYCFTLHHRLIHFKTAKRINITLFKDIPFGLHGDTPIAGDKDWDGDDAVCVYRAFDVDYGDSTTFYFDLNRKNYKGILHN